MHTRLGDHKKMCKARGPRHKQMKFSSVERGDHMDPHFQLYGPANLTDGQPSLVQKFWSGLHPRQKDGPL